MRWPMPRDVYIGLFYLPTYARLMHEPDGSSSKGWWKDSQRAFLALSKTQQANLSPQHPTRQRGGTNHGHIPPEIGPRTKASTTNAWPTLQPATICWPLTPPYIILLWENCAPPTKQEIIAALSTCDNGRAAGLDDIPFEAYKYGGDPMILALTTLFTLIWTWECHPTQWDEASVIPLFKGGPDLCNVDPYRAITLLSTASKVYEAFMLQRITTILDRNVSLSPAQGGFQPQVGPQETVYCLLALLHHRKASCLPSYVAFVDFETAFPSTFKPVVWTSLHALGIRNSLWKNTRGLYAHIRSRVLRRIL
jgi:hypothetical protein